MDKEMTDFAQYCSLYHTFFPWGDQRCKNASKADTVYVSEDKSQKTNLCKSEIFLFSVDRAGPLRKGVSSDLGVRIT